MERIAAAAGTLSQGREALKNPRQALTALLKLLPAIRDWRLSLSQKLDRTFGDNEAVKCALAANLSYYHDDPATLWWVFFAMAQGGYLQSGGRYVQGGSQRLSSALARAIRAAGGEVMLRRVVSRIAVGSQGGPSIVTHTARDGSDPGQVEGLRIVSNAAPSALASLLPAAVAQKLTKDYAQRTPSISLFALTLGLSKPPREFGISAYSTQLLPREMKRLSDYAQGATLMAGDPGERMPPMSVVDLRRDRFGGARAALCALDHWARPFVELGQFGHGRLSREARAMAGCDRWLSLFILSGPRGRCGRVVVQHRAVGAAISRCPRRRGLWVRPDPAALTLAHACPFAAHSGARPLSGVGLCGVRRLYRRRAIRRRVRRHDSTRAIKESVGVDTEPERPGSDERNQIALPLPGGGLAQRRDQFIVGLRPRRRTSTVLQRAGDKDHRVARHRELAPAALAPQFQRRRAIVADLQRRQPLRPGLRRRIQCHLEPERKSVIGMSHTGVEGDRGQ
jgi:hypothetical protein